MDAQTNIYLQYYKAQRGGQIQPVQGARRAQYGGGLGDILRGIFRSIFPIVARGASTFLSEAVQSHDSGKGWGEAAKSAIAPTIGNVAKSTLDKIASAAATDAAAASQSGTGNDESRAPSRALPRRAYKSHVSSAKKHSAKPAKRIKFINF